MNRPDTLAIHDLLERLRRMGSVGRWTSLYRELRSTLDRFPDLRQQLSLQDLSLLGLAGPREIGPGNP